MFYRRLLAAFPVDINC